VNTFGTWPGYQSGATNGPLTGWTNGILPQGTKVGFIQVTGLATSPATTTLSNTISGLTPGESYRLTFNFNARHNNAPNGSVTVAGNTLNFRANAVEAAPNRTLPFRTASVVFTATAPTETFSVSNSIPGAGDTTLLIDNFQVAPGSTKWRATPWADDAGSGIDPARIYTHAYNLGSDLPTAINGVNFTPLNATNPAVPGSFSTTGWTTVIGTDDVNQLTAAGGGSAELARRFVYGGAAQAAQSITLDGLTPGVPNHLILYGVGWSDAGAIARSMTFSDGAGDVATLNEHLLGVDQGVKIEFDYVPNGTSQTFTLTPTASNTTFHLYGFANSIVPEPTALGLIGAGALLINRRRRRR
jgi:hypothetical protein